MMWEAGGSAMRKVTRGVRFAPHSSQHSNHFFYYSRHQTSFPPLPTIRTGHSHQSANIPVSGTISCITSIQYTLIGGTYRSPPPRWPNHIGISWTRSALPSYCMCTMPPLSQLPAPHNPALIPYPSLFPPFVFPVFHLCFISFYAITTLPLPLP